MSAQISIISGPDQGRSFPLTAGNTLQIGRSQASTTKLSDATVSRVHCEIEYDGNRALLINISSNGTLLNGKSITQQELRHGDLVRIGGTEFRYQVAEVSEAETAFQSAAPTKASPEQLSALPGQ